MCRALNKSIRPPDLLSKIELGRAELWRSVKRMVYRMEKEESLPQRVPVWKQRNSSAWGGALCQGQQKRPSVCFSGRHAPDLIWGVWICPRPACPTSCLPHLRISPGSQLKGAEAPSKQRFGFQTGRERVEGGGSAFLAGGGQIEGHLVKLSERSSCCPKGRMS